MNFKTQLKWFLLDVGLQLLLFGPIYGNDASASTDEIKNDINIHPINLLLFVTRPPNVKNYLLCNISAIHFICLLNYICY